MLAIDSNDLVDKIYASGDFFGFYKIISQPAIPVTDIRESLTWNSQQPDAQIQETGSVFKFENSNYKVKLSDTSPLIRYIGTPTRNSLGEGGYYDTIDITWGIAGNDTRHEESYALGALKYTDIQRSDDEIVYKTQLISSKVHEPIASLSVKYIFNDQAVKREITVTNDRENAGRIVNMDVHVYSSVFIPMTDFEFHLKNPDEDEKAWINRKIYPAQGSIILKDRIIDSIFYNYGKTGLYVLYDTTAPYPNWLSYSGSTQYDYGAVNMVSDYSLRPSEATTVSQYFSVNNKATAIKNAEEYRSVSAYPFRDGQLPLIITGQASGTNLTVIRQTAQEIVSRNQTPYTLAMQVTPTNGTFNLPGIIPAGYFNACYNATFCKNSTVQDKELELFKKNTGATGILTSPGRYNLTTFKSLSGNDYEYAEMLSVSAPDGPYYQEGLRNPKFAYVEGENTGIVLLPVTSPSSSALSSRTEPRPVFSIWNGTINSVRDIGGVAALLWDPAELGDPEFGEMFEKFINDAEKRGVTVTTPDAIARHIRQLESVQVNVTRGNDYVTLNARNTGGQTISGITYQLIMPVIDGACPYTINDGTISRSDINDGKCRVYASFDLNENETKEIKIGLGIPVKQLFPVIPELYGGKNTIRITDGNYQPVSGASVRIDSQYYETNKKGEVTFSVNYGWRTITIEKAGYTTFTTTTYVKPLFYRYVIFMNNITI